ncbi:hypothetical protein RSAG8_07384, partial [Rhizoctonia solani AG-8 WAC10335]
MSNKRQKVAASASYVRSPRITYAHLVNMKQIVT